MKNSEIYSKTTSLTENNNSETIPNFKSEFTQKKLIDILSKGITKREDLHFLCKSLLAVDSLKSLTKNSDETIFEKISKRLTYDFHRKGSIIVKYGEYKFSYHIIVRGQALIYIPRSKDSEDSGDKKALYKVAASFVTDPGIFKNSRKVIRNKNNGKASILDLDGNPMIKEFFPQDMYHLKDLEYVMNEFKFIKVLGPGDGFGEISIITNSRRKAYVICSEDTHLITLSRDSYEKIIGEYISKSLKTKLEFLKGFRIFRDIHESKLLSLLSLIKIRKYSLGEFVYKEGSISKEIFLIYSGKIELSKSIEIPKKESKFEDKIDEETKNKILEENNIFWKVPKFKKIKISELANNELFGEEEFVSSSVRKYDSRVISNETEIFAIKKEDLLPFFSDNQLSILFTEVYNERTKYRNSRVDSIERSIREKINPISKAKSLGAGELYSIIEEIKTSLNPNGEMKIENRFRAKNVNPKLGIMIKKRFFSKNPELKDFNEYVTTLTEEKTKINEESKRIKQRCKIIIHLAITFSSSRYARVLSDRRDCHFKLHFLKKVLGEKGLNVETLKDKSEIEQNIHTSNIETEKLLVHRFKAKSEENVRIKEPLEIKIQENKIKQRRQIQNTPFGKSLKKMIANRRIKENNLLQEIEFTTNLN